MLKFQPEIIHMLVLAEITCPEWYGRHPEIVGHEDRGNYRPDVGCVPDAHSYSRQHVIKDPSTQGH